MSLSARTFNRTKIGDLKMSATLYQVLASALSRETAPGSMTSGANVPAQPIVLLNAFPMTLDPNDYANARSTGNPNGDMRALWRFRQLVDPLPQFSQFYMPSSLLTESTYRQIVQGAVIDGDNSFASDVIGNAKRTLQYQSFSNMDGTPGSWLPVYCVPDDWYDVTELDRYNKVSLDLTQITGNGGAGNLPEWQRGDSMGTPATQPLDTASKIHSASMKYLMVNIVRPWFDALLFATDGWYLSGQMEGFCSSGQNDGRGVIPLVPASLILGTDVSIEADWSTKDRQIMEDAKSAQKQLSLGPLLIQPGSQKSSIQVIGWMMSLLPFSPQISKQEAGSVLVKNTGAFIGRFSVQYEKSGRGATVSSGNFPALSAKNIEIPADATDISVKIEVMTFPEPIETWATVATYNFDQPAIKCYKLSGTTFKPYIAEIQCSD
jgi:hypothetical protein